MKYYKVIGVNKAGIIYTLVSAGLGLVAVNSGNNLMYLITAMLLGFLLSSGIAGRRNLYGAELSVAFPDEIYAGEQCVVSVSVANKKRSAPIFFISIEFAADEAFFSLIEPGQSAKNFLLTKFMRRGRHKAGLFYVSSIYPFNLFKRYRHVIIEDDVVVFPYPLKCSPDEIFINENPEDDNRTKDHGKVIAETDVAGLRPYEEGDSIRRVHWKSSARTGKLNTKLYEGEGTGAGRIIALDRIVSGGIEKGLSMASYVISESMNSGTPIGMLINGSLIPPSAVRQHKLMLLEMLADYKTGNRD